MILQLLIHKLRHISYFLLMVVAHLVPNFIVIIVNRNYVFCSNPIFSVNDNNNDEVGDNKIKKYYGNKLSGYAIKTTI